MHNTALPVTIIGGYLGAGKTTLVNHLLSNAGGMRLAVLVNDFGNLPIDASLVESRNGDVINLSGGCVCCSYGDDLQSALMNLNTLDEVPEHILIEASGVALPGAIGSALSLIRALRLHSIVAVADAETIQHNAQDKYLADTIDRQLHDADIILLNKTDLIDKDSITQKQQWINSINPLARVINTSQASVGNDIILDSKPTSLPRQHNQPSRAHPFNTVELPVNQRVNAQTLAQQLAHEESGLVRAKGFVIDTDDELKTIQVVGRRWSVSAAPAGAVAGLVCIGITSCINEQRLATLTSLAAQTQTA